MKRLLNPAFFAITVAACPNTGLADLKKDLFLGQLKVCSELAVFGVEMIEWKQGPDASPATFTNVRRSLTGDGIVARTTFFLLSITENQIPITDATNKERWQTEVYRMGFEFCRNETGF